MIRARSDVTSGLWIFSSVLIWFLGLALICVGVPAGALVQGHVLHELIINHGQAKRTDEKAESSRVHRCVCGCCVVDLPKKIQPMLRPPEELLDFFGIHGDSGNLLDANVSRKQRLSVVFDAIRHGGGKANGIGEVSGQRPHFDSRIPQKCGGFSEVAQLHSYRISNVGVWNINLTDGPNSHPGPLVIPHDGQLPLHGVQLHPIDGSEKDSEHDSPDSVGRIRWFVHGALLLSCAAAVCGFWSLFLWIGARLFVRNCSAPVRSLMLLVLLAVSATQLLESLRVCL